MVKLLDNTILYNRAFLLAQRKKELKQRRGQSVKDNRTQRRRTGARRNGERGQKNSEDRKDSANQQNEKKIATEEGRDKQERMSSII